MQFNDFGKRRSHPALTQMLRVMKITTVLLLALTLQISATGYSQKVTLNLRNVPLLKVLREIRKQTGFSFFYNSETLKQAGRENFCVE